jgi:hypothetical protein
MCVCVYVCVKRRGFRGVNQEEHSHGHGAGLQLAPPNSLGTGFGCGKGDMPGPAVFKEQPTRATTNTTNALPTKYKNTWCVGVGGGGKGFGGASAVAVVPAWCCGRCEGG